MKKQIRGAPAADQAGEACGTTLPPAEGVSVTRASDPSDAVEAVTGLFLPHRLHLSSGDEPLDMQLSALAVGSVTVGRLGYGRDLRLVTDEASEFHVNVPLSGAARSRSGRSAPLVTDTRTAAVFHPGHSADIEWSRDCTQLCLMIPGGVLESELERLLGRSLVAPLQFDFAMDLANPMGRSWADALRLVNREMEDGPDVASHPLAARHVERLLLDGILLGQEHNYSEAIMGPARPGATGPVARAVELLQERPGEPWSTVTLAREVHLSLRSLQEGFRRDVGRPPMTYLRDVRLRRTHDELRAAAPSSTTVSAVASRWGIVHMGRFAAAYRKAFGETPSQTLARLPD